MPLALPVHFGGLCRIFKNAHAQLNRELRPSTLPMADTSQVALQRTSNQAVTEVAKCRSLLGLTVEELQTLPSVQVDVSCVASLR